MNKRFLKVVGPAIFIVCLRLHGAAGPSIPELLADEFIAEQAEQIAQAELKRTIVTDPEEMKRELYIKFNSFEKQFEKFNFSELPVTQIAGGLIWKMSLDEMRNAIREKFKALYHGGKILTKDQFDKIKHAYYTGPGSGSDKLTRIWGADYLKKYFVDHNVSYYDVPEYVLVVDDPRHIAVKLGLAGLFPKLELFNGRVYFANIRGKSVAKESELLRQTGYKDFKDPGNVIEDEQTGKRFVVDTEIKSFEPLLSPKDELLFNYAKRRFWMMNKPNTDMLGNYIITIEL